MIQFNESAAEDALLSWMEETEFAMAPEINEIIATNRDALLPKLFSGDIRIAEAEHKLKRPI